MRIFFIWTIYNGMKINYYIPKVINNYEDFVYNPENN